MTGQTEFRAALLDPGRAAPAGLTDPRRPPGRQAVRRLPQQRHGVAGRRAGNGVPGPREAARRRFLPPDGPRLPARPSARKPGADVLRRGDAGVSGQLPAGAALGLPARYRPAGTGAAPVLPRRRCPAPRPRTRWRSPPERLMAARIGHRSGGLGCWPRPGRSTRSGAPTPLPGAPAPEMRAEDVLVGRPGFDPRRLRSCPAGGAAFVTALAGGHAASARRWSTRRRQFRPRRGPAGAARRRGADHHNRRDRDAGD